MIDAVCVKILAGSFDENLVALLGDIARITCKNKISNYATRKILSNNYFFNILVFIINGKNEKELIDRESEIQLIFEIFFKVFKEDDGRLICPNSKKIMEIIEKIKEINSKEEDKDNEMPELDNQVFFFIKI